jgi:hypothetical protein
MENKKNILNSVNSSENPFKVPENYFSNFVTNFEKKISKQKPQIKERSLLENIKPWFYIAASFLLFVLGIQFYLERMVVRDKNVTENIELIDIQEEDPSFLYTYLDDLTLIEYLISDEKYEN